MASSHGQFSTVHHLADMGNKNGSTPPSYSDTDEKITAIFFRVHHVPPTPHAVQKLRRTYWMLRSDSHAFERWVRTMTAVIDATHIIFL